MYKIIRFIFGIGLLIMPFCIQAQNNTINFNELTTQSELTVVDPVAERPETTLTDMPDRNKNQYEAILAEKNFNFSITAILRGILGMLAILAIAWLFSVNRKAIDWGTVGKGLLIQVVIAIAVLLFGPVQAFFNFFGKCFVAVLDWTKAGSEFLFGSLLDMDKFGYIFAFQILPTIIFFSALMSLLFYLGIVQKIVWVMAWLMSKAMRLSGAESLATAGNIFLGQTESPLMIKPYISSMSKSEVMLIMTAGMSTMAGGVLAAYIGMLGGGDKIMEMEFARHLLSASVMAAPGAVVISKMLVPQTDTINTKIKVTKEKIGKNVLDSISNGTFEGLRLAANVAGMLLVFYALIAGFNMIIGKIGDWTSLNSLIAEVTDGRYSGLSLQFLLGYLFSPLIWLIGITPADVPLVGQLLGQKLILTEFVGYSDLSEMLKLGVFTDAKSIIMATYVLCGFANFASVGIQIGGIGSIAPNQKPILAQFGMRALLGGTLTALASATIVGMVLG
ncbi:MAG: Na+ dependent nucleoside transporter [Prevotellaceae bacterium]|jgi:CNT family concentrative nucleoside transporter|nr:Na+ dependent nucleoside transporter [Prevotellaceae bacterium]